jgi:hypothetical protein
MTIEAMMLTTVIPRLFAVIGSLIKDYPIYMT